MSGRELGCLNDVCIWWPWGRASDASSNFHNSIPVQIFYNVVLISANQKSLGEKERLNQQSLEKTTVFLKHSDGKFQACIKQHHPLTKYHIAQDGACTGFCLLTLCTETRTEQNAKLWQAISKWPYLEAVSKMVQNVSNGITMPRCRTPYLPDQNILGSNTWCSTKLHHSKAAPNSETPNTCCSSSFIYIGSKKASMLNKRTWNCKLSPATSATVGQEQLLQMSPHHGLRKSRTCLQTS